MDYAVRCITPESASDPVYHLLSSEGALLLVATISSQTEGDGLQQLRLVQPDGKVLATIDLTRAAIAGEDQKGGDYALVHDFAVYAILSEHRRPPSTEGAGNGVYFTLEVEGECWLALAHPDSPDCFILYDEVPAGLNTYNKLTELDLPVSIGRVCGGSGESCFDVDLPPHRLQQTPLVILALSFMIDRARMPG